MDLLHCYCGSGEKFSNCCEKFIKRTHNPTTPEELMRSRYAAYVTQAVDYLIETTHRSTRKNHSKASVLEWSKSNHWLRLEVLESRENTVEFKAYYLEDNLKAQIHHEKSTFKKESGIWFYVDGVFY